MASIVKEGNLMKRGEFIQNLRARWFVLKADGSFRGFKQKPAGPEESPLNVFDVQRCEVIPLNPSAKAASPKKGDAPYGFSIRFMQMTRMFERTFFLENADERDAWIKAITDIRSKVSATLPEIDRARAVSYVDPKKPVACDITIDSFELLKVLGKGTFGKVMLCRHKATSEVLAMKVLRKDHILEKGELAHTFTENSVLAKCSHPFITSLKYSFQTADHIFFVMEYVNGGELFVHLRRSKVFPEDRVRFYAGEITLALTYLHDNGIVYRDLKLENLLLDRFGHIKITDFGLSKEEMTFGARTTTFCGTPEYLAPEVLEDAEYGRAVDWWGLGAIMYEMICGKVPFQATPGDWDKLFELVLTQEIVYPAIFSPLAKDLLSKLMIRTPSERLGGSARDGFEVLEHPFFASIDLVKLKRKEVPPPFVPKVESETDVSNFDPHFTKEVPRVSPTAPSPFTNDEKDESFANFESVTISKP